MANASYRYTGANAVILFNGTALQNDYTEVNVELSIRTEERTAGNEADASFNATIKEGKASFKRYDTGQNDGGLATALRIGNTGTLEIRPKGTATGYPAISFPAIVTSYKLDLAFDKNSMTEVEFLKNGAMIYDSGAVQ